MKLSDKEKLFCSRYASTGDAISSLEYAGYSQNLCKTKKALTLLEKSDIQKKIQEYRLEDKKKLESTVLCGLKRLAFGNVTGQVRALMQKSFKSANNLKSDLFNVQEIKIPHDNAIEIKFFNRQSAMEKLLQFIKDSNENDVSTDNLADILSALKNS